VSAAPPALHPAEPAGRTRVSNLLLAAAPAAFTLVFWVRAIGGPAGPDAVLMAIGAVFAVAAVALATGRRAGAVAFVIAPFALVLSPSGQELSFNLVADDSAFWRWHAVVAALTAGGAAVTAVAALVGSAATRSARAAKVTTAAVAALVPIGGLATLGTLAVQAPLTYAGDLDAAERAQLPVVELLDFEFAALPDSLAPGETWTALVRNPTELPHTLTADQVGVDLYVPAGREAVVQFVAPESPLVVICTVGDHADLGMVATIPTS
jgi:hypothetical protein